MAINVIEGGCATTPASCLDAGSGTGTSGQVSVALTGGTTYCFVCEVGFSQALQLDLSTAGDCGALPVEVQSFSIE